MTVNVAELQEALRQALPDAQAAGLARLAEIVAGLADRTIAPEDAKSALAAPDLAELVRSLGGKSVNAGPALVDFSNAVGGSFQVGDIAGGSIVKIVVNLGPVEVTDVGEFSEIEAHLASLLNDVDGPVLDLVAKKMGLTLAGGLGDKRWALARRLLSTDLESLLAAAAVLASQICVRVESLVDLAAAFCWVKPACGTQVKDAVMGPGGRRSLVLDSSNVPTGRMYLRSASYEFLPPWDAREVPALPEAPADVDKVLRASVIDAVGGFVEGVDDLEEELRRRPVVLLWSAPVPTSERLAEIRAQGLGSVSFFFLDGKAVDTAFESSPLPGVDFLHPVVDRRGEKDIERLRIRIRSTCGGTR